jgi:hypothetical protein
MSATNLRTWWLEMPLIGAGTHQTGNPAKLLAFEFQCANRFNVEIALQRHAEISIFDQPVVGNSSWTCRRIIAGPGGSGGSARLPSTRSAWGGDGAALAARSPIQPVLRKVRHSRRLAGALRRVHRRVSRVRVDLLDVIDVVQRAASAVADRFEQRPVRVHAFR